MKKIRFLDFSFSGLIRRLVLFFLPFLILCDLFGFLLVQSIFKNESQINLSFFHFFIYTFFSFLIPSLFLLAYIKVFLENLRVSVENLKIQANSILQKEKYFADTKILDELIPVSNALENLKTEFEKRDRDLRHEVFENLKNKEKFQLVFELSKSGYVLYCKEQGILEANQSACNLLGIKSSQILGRHLLEISSRLQLNGKESAKVREEIESIVREVKYHRFHWIYQAQNREIIPVEETLIWTFFEGREMFFSVWHSLREKYEFEQSLLQMTKNLHEQTEIADKALEARRSFLRNITHELKTPLNSVIGMSEICMENLSNPQKLQSPLTNIKNSARSLLKIIEDVLEISKEPQNEHLKEVPFSFESILLDLHTTLSEAATKKGIQLLFTGTFFPRIYLGDKGKILRILMSLCDNAIKFTEHGTVTLEIHEENDSPGTAQVTISVLDTGKGIEKEHLPRLFEEFHQGDSRVCRQYSGLGLGLFMVKNLVTSLSGKISVECLPSGSLFTVNLPLKIQENLLAVSFEKNTFLVLEPCKITRTHLCYILEKANLNILACENISEAKEKIKTAEVRGLFIGWNPEEQSFAMEFLKMIRQETLQLSAVLLCDLPFPHDPQFFFDHSIAGVLQKPVLPSKIYEIIRLILGNKYETMSQNTIMTPEENEPDLAVALDLLHSGFIEAIEHLEQLNKKRKGTDENISKALFFAKNFEFEKAADLIEKINTRQNSAIEEEK